MFKNLKTLFTVILVVCLCTQEKICEHLGFGHAKLHKGAIAAEPVREANFPGLIRENAYTLNDTIYRWDERLLNWVVDLNALDWDGKLVDNRVGDPSQAGPIVVDWKVLLDIRYKLKYFSEFEMEIFAPIFSETLKSLHGKEVIIKGFVIPIDESEEVLALSFGPYSSCFFCGKASPASIISVYMRDKKGRYQLDDRKKFRGTLYLNHNDPDEFYYVLRDAREEGG